MFGKRSMLRSGKLAKKRRRVLYLKLALLVLVLVGIVGGTAYGLARPEVTIQDISVRGNEVLSENEIRALVEQEISGRYLLLFAKRDAFIYPRRHIVATLSDTYKRIRSVSVERSGLQELVVNIEERDPFALWCGEERLGVPEAIATTTNSEERPCYFLDNRGYVFAPAPHFTGDVYFRYFGELSDAHEVVGSYYLTDQTFGELSLFFDALQKIDFVGMSLAMTADDYDLSLARGGSLRFSRDQDLSVVLSNLESALDSDALKDADMEKLEYIDLRFDNRVYYKFKS